jgi:guanine deaminase
MQPEQAMIGIRGHLIDAPHFGKIRSRCDGALVIENGRIIEVGEYEFLRKKARATKVRWLHTANSVVLPGLIDIHSHVPQYPAVAKGTSDLLPWLRQSIFPLEREFTGPKGRREAAHFFQEIARHGTTTAMLYTAIYEDSCDAAFSAAEKAGLRIIMGKMMMDVCSYGQQQPHKVVSISLHESDLLCKKWHGASDGLLEYAFSPRFAVSCSEKLMRGAAELALQHGAYIQTHLSENTGEIEKVRNQFSWAKDYTDIYEKCGLLTERTVLGHCIHLSRREIDVLSENRAAVAHCPTANFFLSSGIMKLDELLDAGIRIGLGTDVAAGPELNLWQVMRSTIEAQKARSFYEKNVRVPSPADAFHLATQGAATALGKGEIIGSLDAGKEADLLILDATTLLPNRKPARGISDMSAEDILSLCVYRGGPQAVLETFVRGQSIYRAPEPELF